MEKRIFSGYSCIVLGTPGSNDCLKRIACQDPQQAQKYAMAGSALLKIAKMLSLQPDGSYEIALKELEDAANRGSTGNDCQRYKCGQEDVASRNQT